jgi:hypothetical protein
MRNQKEGNESTVALRRLEFKLTKLNATSVHEIGETPSATIMEISDDSASG